MMSRIGKWLKKYRILLAERECDTARQTAEYWKAGYLAGNAEIERLNGVVFRLNGENAELYSRVRELLPCPFCGDVPELPSGDGTQYEIECGGCGQAIASVQICDLMTSEERATSSFTNCRYAEEFVERAKRQAVKNWNLRTLLAEQPQAGAGQHDAEIPAPYGWMTSGKNKQKPIAWLTTARKPGVTEQRSLWHGEDGADQWVSHFQKLGCETKKIPLYELEE